MSLHWGIVSAGKISNDFASALAVLPKTDHEIVAVGARSLSRAQQFAETHGIPEAHEGYAKIAKHPKINIVYIGNLNPQHYEVSKLMLEGGKHVLCEKPLTLNEKQTRSLVEIAKTKKMFLMEGIWSRLFPVYHKLRELLEAGSIGDVLNVQASFGFNLQSVERLTSKDLGGSTILDLGVYTLQLQQLVYKSKKPTRILGTGATNSNGVDEVVNAILEYPNGRAAIINISSRTELPNRAVIIGTQGIIEIPNFWCPTQLICKDKIYEFPLPKSDGTFNFSNSVGLSYEAEHVRQCIASGQTESLYVSLEDSIQLAQLMDDLRQQLGVVFAED